MNCLPNFSNSLRQFEQIRQLSADPNNVIVGLARDKDATIKKVKEELGEIPNVHILRGDLDDRDSLKASSMRI